MIQWLKITTMDMKYVIVRTFVMSRKIKYMFFANSEYLHQHVMVVLMTVLL
jgi:hypothetical protein